jgi:hypothetical protein
MTSKILIADLVGLTVVFAALTLVVFVARSSDVPLFLWAIAFVVVGVIAIGIWHGEKWPTTPFELLKVAGSSVLLGALFYIADTVIAHFEHPEVPIWLVGTKAGSMFGFVVTAAVCPGLTTIALAGVARAICLYKDI